MVGEERLLGLEVGGRRLAAALHDVGGPLVMPCHGFRGDRTGPARLFVRTARALAARGVSSLRFDQHGSGDSPGEFTESRFDDWTGTIAALAQEHLDAGRRVALLGQSMGASAATCAAARAAVGAVVAWVPDPETDPYEPDGSGAMEEGGQRVADAFWEQAHAADVVGRLREVVAPVRLVLATADEHVSEADRAALVRATKPADVVEVHEGWPHSAWTWDQATEVARRSTDFLVRHLVRREAQAGPGAGRDPVPPDRARPVVGRKPSVPPRAR